MIRLKMLTNVMCITILFGSPIEFSFFYIEQLIKNLVLNSQIIY